jgi:hypothetical protein
MNVFILQRLMGHKALKVLLRYLALVEQDLQKGHEQHGVVNFNQPGTCARVFYQQYEHPQ